MPKAPDRTRYGATGTTNFAGAISGHEHLSELQGTRLVTQVNKMMSDPTVWGSFLFITLPIRAASWSIEQGEADEEVAEFVHDCIFEKLGNFSEWLGGCLDYLPYGRMPYEKIWAFDRDSKRWYWEDLAVRLPGTVSAWNQGANGKLASIDQQVFDDATASFRTPNIPAEKLILFINERRGNNYEGRSFFRGAYQPWFYKSKLYVIDALAAQRHGMGILDIEIPADASEDEETQALEVLENLFAHESSGIVRRPGWVLQIHGLSGRPMDVLPSIKHHDERIAAQMLTQWSMLGMTETGSRSVGEVQIDPYFLGLKAVTNHIVATLKPHIRELVDYNFPNVEVYPELKCEKLQPKNIQVISEALAKLASGGFDFSDKETQNEMREVLGIKTKLPDDWEKPAPTLPVDDPAPPDPSYAPADPAGTKAEQVDGEKPEDEEGKTELSECTCGKSHHFFAEVIKDVGDELKLWRMPEGPEMFVALADIADDHQESKERLKATLAAGEKALVEPLTKAADLALKSGSLDHLKEFVPNSQANLSARIARIFASNFRRGKREVMDEVERQKQGKTINPLIRQRAEGKRVFALADVPEDLLNMIPEDVWLEIQNEADLIAALEVAKMKKKALSAVNAALARGSLDIEPIRDTLTTAVDEGLATIAADYGAYGFARGREVQAKDYDQDVKEVQRSGILDGAICPVCEERDGKVYDSLEEAETEPTPDPDCEGTTARCRCMQILVLKSEKDPRA